MIEARGNPAQGRKRLLMERTESHSRDDANINMETKLVQERLEETT